MQTLRVRSKSLVLITSLITRFQWTGFWRVAFQGPMTQLRAFDSTAAMLVQHCTLSCYSSIWTLKQGFPDFLTECKLTCLQSSHNKELIFVFLMTVSFIPEKQGNGGDLYMCFCFMVASGSQGRLYALCSFWCPRSYNFIQV